MSSGGFTKLVSGIVHSSIWDYAPEVRCVWVAMLATKDKDGFVRGTLQSLSRLANVSVEHTEEALALFLAPDPESRTTDHEGRRIEEVPGGWFVLNHDLYRARTYQEAEAARKRAYRARKAQQKENSPHTPLKENYTEADTEAEAEQSGTCPDVSGTCPGQPAATTPPSSGSVFGFDVQTAVIWMPCTKPANQAQEAVCRIAEDPTPGYVWEMAIPQAWLDEWQEVYPQVLLLETLREIRQKIRDSGKYVKTPQGMRRFIGSWLHREQNR